MSEMTDDEVYAEFMKRFDGYSWCCSGGNVSSISESVICGGWDKDEGFIGWGDNEEAIYQYRKYLSENGQLEEEGE